jgi:hypothetical protein
MIVEIFGQVSPCCVSVGVRVIVNAVMQECCASRSTHRGRMKMLHLMKRPISSPLGLRSNICFTITVPNPIVAIDLLTFGTSFSPGPLSSREFYTTHGHTPLRFGTPILCLTDPQSSYSKPQSPSTRIPSFFVVIFSAVGVHPAAPSWCIIVS